MSKRVLAVIVVVAMSAPKTAAQGVVLPSGGPISRSMAGASTATSIAPDSAYWNPATLSGLPTSSFLFGAEMLYADIHFRSSLPAGTIGGVFPPVSRSGVTRSDSGLAAVPAFAMAWHVEDTPLTVGMSMFALMGGSVNYPGDIQTPVLTPNDPKSGFFGFGPNAASAVGLGIAPAISYQATEKLAVGIMPIISSLTMSLDPAFFAGRNDANGDGVSSFPPATHSRPFWGGAIQFGVLYNLTPKIDIGFSYRSPTWYETWYWNSRDEVGRNLRLELEGELPMIFSFGVAFRPIDGVLLACDVRYFNYRDTELFGEAAPPNGAGLGWENIFAIALGGQFQLTERIAARIGYLFNENPIPNTATLFNVQLPGILQHTLSLGMSYEVNDWISANIGYAHGFRNNLSGPVAERLGAAVDFDAETDSVLFGLHFRFGPRVGRGLPVVDNSQPMILDEIVLPEAVRQQ